MRRRSAHFCEADVLERLLASLRSNWTLKLIALGLALLLWSVVQAESQTRVTVPDVPIRVVLRDPDWVMTAPPAPPTVSVVFSGPIRELFRLFTQPPELVVPVDAVRDTSELHVLRTAWVALQPGLDNTRVDDVRPSTARLSFDRITTRIVPLALPISAPPADGFELAGPIRLDPPAVGASGAAARIARLDSLRLAPLDLRRIRGFDTLTVAIDTTGLGLQISPRSVRIIVPMQRVPEPDEPADPPVAGSAVSAAPPG
jgi:YbbR domain-containing protein